MAFDFPAAPTANQVASFTDATTGEPVSYTWTDLEKWRRTGSTAVPPISTDITVTGINPATAIVGSAAFTLTVTGSNFVSGTTQIIYNGAPVTTAFVSSDSLTTQVTPPAAAGTATVNVSAATTGDFILNFISVGGGLTPVITNVVPASVSKAAGVTAVTVTGNNFFNNSVVSYNGNSSAITTTVVSKTQITCQIDATGFTVGSGSMMVINGGIKPSNQWPFSVTA